MKMFSKRLWELLKDKHLSQKELAEHLGITRQSVSQYINGVTEPCLSRAWVIADFLGVSIDYLAGRSELKNNDEPSKKELEDKVKQELLKKLLR